MKKKTLAFIFAVSVLSSAIAQTPADLASSLQAVVNNTVPSGMINPGLVAAVHVPGQWSWYGASGNSIAGTTPGHSAATALATDRFRVGSITKMFMATAILQLEEAGLLDIEDDISLYLRYSLVNDTIKSSDVVAIKNLLDHTSGIADLAANDSCRMAALADLTRDYTLEEIIYCGCIQGEYFPPGFAWGYSNTNYAILALIIKEVSGLSAADYITANIINPLGLMNTEVPVTDEIGTSHMGCYWDLPPLLDLTIVDASLYNGWANIVSSTEDLFLFFDALRNGSLVNASSLAKMFSVSSASFDYGLAIDYYEIDGDSYYGHSGEVGNTSGLFFGDISTAAFPDGYYIVYNYNYQGVNYNAIEESVHMLMKNYVPNTTTTHDTALLSDTFGDKSGKMLVFPNPATDQFSIKLNGDINTAARLEICDVTGRKISGFTQMISTGLLKVSGLDLEPGIYQVIYGLGENSYTCPLLIR